jgi:hypothetical protein
MSRKRTIVHFLKRAGSDRIELGDFSRELIPNSFGTIFRAILLKNSEKKPGICGFQRMKKVEWVKW